ncbi:MAG TPA: signal peptidase I [Blastocatellia bacterium]|nr:signal peptidase I [Blastocatellia bacterium]
MAEETTKTSANDGLVTSSGQGLVGIQPMHATDDERSRSPAAFSAVDDGCGCLELGDSSPQDDAPSSEGVLHSVGAAQAGVMSQPMELLGAPTAGVGGEEGPATPDEIVTVAHLWQEAKAFLRDLVFAVLIAILVIVFVVQPVRVEGTSMLPRLHDGERIFVNKFIYRFEKIERGDIVVFWYPNDPSKSFIKRVIGLPGETISIREGVVYVDGMPLEEKYIDPAFHVRRENMPPVYVRDHYYFVMGDNRDSSNDSRQWGLVPEKYIYGKAIFRYWPLSSFGTIN